MSDRKKMTTVELRDILAQMINGAIKYVDTELSPKRAKATKYYNGELFGDEEDGRSKVVLTEFRDSVLGVMPDMLTTIFGPEHVVEYAPRNEQQVEAAEQATEYIRYVFEDDNPGFLTTYSVLKDGFVRALGTYKWGWDDTSSIKNYRLIDIKESIVEQLLQDDDIKLTRATRTKEAVPPAQGILGPNGVPVQQGSPGEEAEFTIEFTRNERDGRGWVKAVPPEELIHDREARDAISDYTLIGHKMRKTAGELIQLGISQADIDEHGGDDDTLALNQEVTARSTSEITREPSGGEANEKHIYIENYAHIDFDGDKVAELRRICTIGPEHWIVSNEPIDNHPFSFFSPDPEPHVFIGHSMGDITMDLQRLKSSVLRVILDGLSASIFPRIGYVEGHVSYADIMNTAVGAPIRMRQPNDLIPITVPWVGQEAMPLLQLIDDIKEGRTGQSKGALGLDADALQSTEKDAAGAVVSKSQARATMYLRVFAETALKPMFRGLLRLYTEHQPKERMIKLRGRWTPIDPTTWDPDMSVRVNVMMGMALVEQKLGALEAFAAKQELVLSTMGANQPMVSLAQYSNAIRRAGVLRGFQNMDEFFSAVPADWKPAPQPEQPDPKILDIQSKEKIALANIELDKLKLQVGASKDMRDAQLHGSEIQFNMHKLAVERILKEAELKMKAEQGAAQNNTALEQMASTQSVALTELELKYGTQVDVEQFKALQEESLTTIKEEAENLRHAATVANDKMETELRAKLEHERTLVDMQNKHEEKMKPEPKPAPAAAPATPVEIHQHMAGDMQVVRDEAGKISGLKSTDSKKD